MSPLILDTHTFLWWNTEPDRLSTVALTAITEPTAVLYLSIASVWEMQIKIQIGKLLLPSPLSTVIERNQQVNQIELLGISSRHVYKLNDLPAIHKDPFDRLLIAQTLVEDATLVTADSNITGYSVKTIW